MVFDINGPKAPNRVGTDVRTMNSILGLVYLDTNYKPLTAEECEKVKTKLGIQNCGGVTEDKWAGAMKACADLGLHLPSRSTLAKIATMQYGVQIEAQECVGFKDDCSGYTNSYGCVCKTPLSGYVSPIAKRTGNYWTTSEISSTNAYMQYLGDYYSWSGAKREPETNNIRAMCLAD